MPLAVELQDGVWSVSYTHLDPIFFSDRYTKEYHLKAFKSIAEALSGYTEKCVISLDVYERHFS